MLTSESPAPAATGDEILIYSAKRPNTSIRTQRPQPARGLQLRYGRSRTPLASILADIEFPNMWRVVQPGAISDIVNLARAKDAAAAICERGPPARNRGRFHWINKRSESLREARTSRQSREAYDGTR